MFTRSDIKSALAAVGGDPTAAAKMLRQHANDVELHGYVLGAVRGNVAKAEAFASGRAQGSVHFSAFDDVTIDVAIDGLGEGTGISIANRSPTRWIKGDLLGGGSYGQVYAATSIDPSDTKKYAMKIMETEDVTWVDNLDKKFIKEVYYYVKMSEIGVAPDVFDWGMVLDSNREGYFYMVTERFGVSLEDWLDDPDNDLTEETAKRITQKIVSMARAGVAHGDLEARNVLVDGSGEVFIIDYGYTLPLNLTRKTAYQSAADEWYSFFDRLYLDAEVPLVQVPNLARAAEIAASVDRELGDEIYRKHPELAPASGERPLKRARAMAKKTMMS